MRRGPLAVGGVLYTESLDRQALNCSPLPCLMFDQNNTASNYGDVQAMPPSTTFHISMPDAVRSGAPLPLNITLLDG